MHKRSEIVGQARIDYMLILSKRPTMKLTFYGLVGIGLGLIDWLQKKNKKVLYKSKSLFYNNIQT